MKPFLLFTFLFTISLIGLSQFKFEGKVVDENNKPLEFVNVSIHELHRGTYTDSKGFFRFSDLSEGNYHIHIFIANYKAAVLDTGIHNEDIFVDIQLKPIINELDEVVIETNPFKTSQQESSLQIHVINKKYLEKNDGATLINSLEKVEGISTINQGIGVSKPVIRGMSGNRIIVNDLGIKQEGQQWGMDHGLEIDQYNVENVQILKGAASLMYGSDAMTGVLNIIPEVHLDTHSYFHDVQTFYRSNNETVGITAGSKGRTEDLSYKFRVTTSKYQDYKVPANVYTYLTYNLPIYNEKLKNTAGQEFHINGRIGIKKKWGYQYITVSNYNQQIGIFVGASGLPRQYNLSLNSPKDIELPHQDINHFKVISNTNIKLKKNWLELDIGFQSNHRKEYEKAVYHGFPIDLNDSLGVQLDLLTFSWNARYHASLHKKLNGVYGIQGQIQKNTTGGFDFIIPNYQSRQVGAYWIEKYKASKKLIFNGGLRIDYAELFSNESIMPFYYNREYIADVVRTPLIQRNFFNLSGSLGASYQINTKWDTKINVGKTFRIPALAELASNGAHDGTFRYEKGDENLEAEQGYQFDVVLNYEYKKIHITLSPFYNYFSNFIFLNPGNVFPRENINGELYPYPVVGQLYDYQQATVRHYGGEIGLHYHLFKFLSIEGNVESVYAQNLETDLGLPFTPPNNAQVFIEYHPETSNWPFQKNFIRLNMGFYAAQNRVARNEWTTDGYQLMNLSMGTRFGKKKAKTQLTFQIQNLLNEYYFNHLSRYRLINIPEPARNYVISLKFIF